MNLNFRDMISVTNDNDNSFLCKKGILLLLYISNRPLWRILKDNHYAANSVPLQQNCVKFYVSQLSAGHEGFFFSGE